MQLGIFLIDYIDKFFIFCHISRINCTNFNTEASLWRARLQLHYTIEDKRAKSCAVDPPGDFTMVILIFFFLNYISNLMNWIFYILIINLLYFIFSVLYCVYVMLFECCVLSLYVCVNHLNSGTEPDLFTDHWHIDYWNVPFTLLNFHSRSFSHYYSSYFSFYL